MAKPRFQKNHRHRHPWRTDVLGTRDVWSHSRGPRTERSVNDSQWVTWPSDPSIALWVRPHGKRLGLRYPKSTLHFTLGNRAVPCPQKTHGSQWMAHAVETGDARASTLFLFPFSRVLFLSFVIIPTAYELYSELCKIIILGRLKGLVTPTRVHKHYGTTSKLSLNFGKTFR